MVFKVFEIFAVIATTLNLVFMFATAYASAYDCHLSTVYI